MPPKKSARTSVKAKTSVLSSVAVQVALVAGGAAITAAAAAGLSIQLSRTQLAVALVAPTANPIVATAGDKDVQAFGLKFQAVKEDLYVSKVTLGVIADDDADFVKKISNDLDPAKLFAGCWLQEGTRVASDVVLGAPSMGFTLINGFSVAARQSGTLKVVCNLAKQQVAGNTSDRFAFTLAKPADVVAGVNVKGGAVVPPANISFGSTLGGLNTKGSTASVLVKATPGSVVTPPPAVLATYCPDADTDGYPLGGTSCVQAAVAGAGQIAPRADGKLDCDDTNAGTHPGAGEIPGNNIDDDCDGTSLAARLSGAAAAPMVTLASGSPSGASVPSYGAVLRFNVSAPWGADTSLRAFLFRVTSTDNAQTGWNACAGLGQSDKWRLYDANDLTTPLAGTQPIAVLNEQGAPCRYRPGIASFVSMPMEPDVLVSEGTTRTFVLMADMSGASAASDDMLRVEIPLASSLPSTLAANTVTWTERTPPSNWRGDADIRTLPVIGGMIVY